MIRKHFLDVKIKIDQILANVLSKRPDGFLLEHECYDIFKLIKFDVPNYYYFSILQKTPFQLPNGPNFVAKCVLRSKNDNKLVIHKTEVGGISFNVNSHTYKSTINNFISKFGKTDYSLEGVLFREQAEIHKGIFGEMLISGYQDTSFGPSVVFGFGGTAAEYYSKIMKPHFSSVFLPCLFDFKSYERVIHRLPLIDYIEGRVRGVSSIGSSSTLINCLNSFAEFVSYYSPYNNKSKFIIEEAEINPAIFLNGRVNALDGVIRVTSNDKTINIDSEDRISKIRNLISPTSVIITGASNTKMNLGRTILHNCVNSGIKEIYPIHSQRTTIENFHTVSHIRKGDPVDLLIIAIPAKNASELISSAIEGFYAKSIQIISGGFDEKQTDSPSIQNTLKSTLESLPKEKRPVINGPNTVGNHISGGLNTIFVPPDRFFSSDLSKILPDNAPQIGLICQSGAFLVSRTSELSNIASVKIGISTGNQMDLSVVDFLEYYLQDSSIKSFGLYMEGLNPYDGIRLMKLLVKAKSKGKTIVIYKAGVSEAGISAVKTHTAAIAENPEKFIFLEEHAGGIVVDNLSDFNSLLMLASRSDVFVSKLLESKEGEKIGISVISNAGFEKCAAADHLHIEEGSNVHLPKWSSETLSKFRKAFQDLRIHDIVDIGSIMDLSPMTNDRGYERIVRIALEDPSVHACIVGIIPNTPNIKGLSHEINSEEGILSLMKNLKSEFPKKPIIIVIDANDQYSDLRDGFLKSGFPTFSKIDIASRLVSKLVNCFADRK